MKVFRAILPCLLSLSWLATAAPQSGKPNILFIITDQQFADAMSCRMGKQFINTPTMDRLAQSGMLFTRAYSSNPLCMPWRNSVFTGRYPHETGVTQNANPRRRLESEGVRLPGHLLPQTPATTRPTAASGICATTSRTPRRTASRSSRTRSKAITTRA